MPAASNVAGVILRQVIDQIQITDRTAIGADRPTVCLDGQPTGRRAGINPVADFVGMVRYAQGMTVRIDGYGMRVTRNAYRMTV